MSAISLSSFSFRTSQGASLASAQSRGSSYGAYSSARSSSTVAAGRSSTISSGARTSTMANTASSNVLGRNTSGTVNTGTGSAYCPTCGGNVSRSASPASSSYCPTCNRTGGTQSNIAAARSTVASADSDHTHTYGQGGRVCVTCGYQAR